MYLQKIQVILADTWIKLGYGCEYAQTIYIEYIRKIILLDVYRVL